MSFGATLEFNFQLNVWCQFSRMMILHTLISDMLQVEMICFSQLDLPRRGLSEWFKGLWPLHRHVPPAPASGFPQPQE